MEEIANKHVKLKPRTHKRLKILGAKKNISQLDAIVAYLLDNHFKAIKKIRSQSEKLKMYGKED